MKLVDVVERQVADGAEVAHVGADAERLATGTE